MVNKAKKQGTTYETNIVNRLKKLLIISAYS